MRAARVAWGLWGCFLAVAALNIGIQTWVFAGFATRSASTRCARSPARWLLDTVQPAHASLWLREDRRAE